MTPELYKQAIAEQKRRYDALLEVAAEMRDILAGLVQNHKDRDTIHQSWWIAAEDMIRNDYLEAYPGIAIAMRAVYEASQVILKDANTLAIQSDIKYIVSFLSVLGLESAVGDVQRIQAQRMMQP